MRKSRFTEEQIFKILKLEEAGEKVADVSRQHGISQGTFYRWRSRYGFPAQLCGKIRSTCAGKPLEPLGLARMMGAGRLKNPR